MKSSRRSFLQSAGVAATVALTQPGSALFTQGEAAGKSLPEPIAKLKSRKAEAKPITAAERQERLERARQLMATNKLDAILLMGGTSLVYFTGIRWFMSERTFAMIVPVKGDPFYVCPAFEDDRAREQMALGMEAYKPDIRSWQEDESPYQRIADGLKERGIGTGKLGVEETVRYVFSEGVGKVAPAVQIVSATPVTAGCRMIKSQHELQLMTLANQVTLAAYE